MLSGSNVYFLNKSIQHAYGEYVEININLRKSRLYRKKFLLLYIEHFCTTGVAHKRYSTGESLYNPSFLCVEGIPRDYIPVKYIYDPPPSPGVGVY